MSGFSISDFNNLLNSHRVAIANQIADVDVQLDELEEAAQALDWFTQPKIPIVDRLRHRYQLIMENKATIKDKKN